MNRCTHGTPEHYHCGLCPEIEEAKKLTKGERHAALVDVLLEAFPGRAGEKPGEDEVSRLSKEFRLLCRYEATIIDMEEKIESLRGIIDVMKPR